MTTMVRLTALDLAGCPECAAPAEIVDRFMVASTDGPLEHVKVQCVRRHWFLMLTESLPPAHAQPGRTSPVS